MTANPARISTSAGSAIGTLLIGETAIYTAQFIIDQTAYDAQFISNTVTVRLMLLVRQAMFQILQMMAMIQMGIL